MQGIHNDRHEQIEWVQRTIGDVTLTGGVAASVDTLAHHLLDAGVPQDTVGSIYSSLGCAAVTSSAVVDLLCDPHSRAARLNACIIVTSTLTTAAAHLMLGAAEGDARQGRAEATAVVAAAAASTVVRVVVELVRQRSDAILDAGAQFAAAGADRVRALAQWWRGGYAPLEQDAADIERRIRNDLDAIELMPLAAPAVAPDIPPLQGAVFRN